MLGQNHSKDAPYIRGLILRGRQRFILNMAGSAFGAFFLGDVVVDGRKLRAVWWLLWPTSIAAWWWAIESNDPFLYGPLMILTAGPLGLGLWLLSIVRSATSLARSGWSATAAMGVSILAIVLVLLLGLEGHALSVDASANPYAQPLRWGALLGIAAAASGLTTILSARGKRQDGERKRGVWLSILPPFVGLLGLRFFFEGRFRPGLVFLGGGMLLGSVVLSSVLRFRGGAVSTGEEWFLDLVLLYIVLQALHLYAMLWAAQAVDWWPQRAASASGAESEAPGLPEGGDPTIESARSTGPAPAVVYRK